MAKYQSYPFKRKRRNGVWYAHLIWEDESRDIVSLRTRNETIAEAKFRRLQEQIHAKVTGLPRIPVSIPFPAGVTRYLAEGTFDLAPASLERHTWAIEKHLKPFFGTENLTRIGPQRVLDYITARQRDKAAPNTILKELAALSAIFSFHVQRELVPGNPVLAVKKPKLKLVRPNYAPTLAEVIKILNYISPYERRYFLCLWATGARLSEIRRANVGDVDLEARTIRLVRKGGKIQVIGLNSIAYQAIKEELQGRVNLESFEPLFLNRQRRRCGKIHEVLAHACKRAGVPYVTHHGLRHSFARYLRKSGYRLEEISKMLGHKNTYITQTVYVDFRDEEVIETAQKLSIEPLENVFKK